MGQDQSGDSPGGGRKGGSGAAGPQCDPAKIAELEQCDQFMMRQIEDVRTVLMRLAEATSFQFSLENSLQEISNKLTPIQSLGPVTADPDEDQVFAMEKVRAELARPAEQRMYLVGGPGRNRGLAS